jgi:hypothetical protein
MDVQLTQTDCEYLLGCLEHTKTKYESTSYPTYELKQEQFSKLDNVQKKLRAIRDGSV